MAIDEFLQRFGNSEFSWSVELLSAMRQGRCVVRASPSDGERPLSCGHYGRIHAHRAAAIERVGKTKSPVYRELQELSVRLNETPTDTCDVWLFWVDGHTSYVCFVHAPSGRILGCIRGELPESASGIAPGT
jgi:hypothetical protein